MLKIILIYNQLIPTIYKKSFPAPYNSTKSYDMVLLCQRCHEKASNSYEAMKLEISKLYNVPLMVFSDDKQNLKLCESLVKRVEKIKVFNLISLKNKTLATMTKDARRKFKDQLCKFLNELI